MPDFKPQEIKQPAAAPQLKPVVVAAVPSAAQKSFYQSNKFYIWAIALGVVIIAVLAYLAFKPAPPTQVKEADVQIQILAPESLPAGNEAVYRVVMRNNDSAKLTNLELELAYPAGFTYVEGSPKASNISGSVFDLPDLLPQQNVTVIVKVKTAGDINSEKRLLAKLHYKYSNFNSSFVKETAQTFRLTASDVSLEMEGPKETNSAQLVIYTFSYKNNSKDTIKNARIKLVYPAGFNYASSQPPASLGTDTWNLGDLQSGGEGKIILQGSFSVSQPGESKTLSAAFLALGDNGEYFVQNTAETQTSIISQPLLAALEDLDSHKSNVVQPGETLNFSVRFQNNAAVAATGVNLAVSLDSKALDLTSLQAQGGQLVGNSLTWNAAGVPNLESLNPGESGTVIFFVKVKNPATRDSSQNLTVKLAAKIKANEYTTFLPGESRELKVASPAQIQSDLKYLSGSLPPKVGTQTKYKASLKLYNSSNDFHGSELTAFLPSVSGSFNLQSVNAEERNNVQFDSATGKLIWKVGILRAYSGKFIPARVLEFEVTANPGPADVGRSGLLLRNIKFFAQDDFTGEAVDLTTEDVTTASLGGQSGYSNGIVEP